MIKQIYIILVCCAMGVSCYGVVDCNSIAPRFDKDLNNLSGDVNVMIYSNQDMKRITQVLALLDGKKYGEFFLYGDPCDSPMFSTVQMRTQFFTNGKHSISTISKDYNFKIVCRSDVNVVFNNELSSITIDKGYWLGKDFHFQALSSSPSANYTVEVINSPKKIVVYSGNFTGNIGAVIPASAFNDDSQFYELTVKDSTGNVKFRELFGRDYDEEGFKEDEEAE